LRSITGSLLVGEAGLEAPVAAILVGEHLEVNLAVLDREDFDLGIDRNTEGADHPGADQQAVAHGHRHLRVGDVAVAGRLGDTVERLRGLLDPRVGGAGGGDAQRGPRQQDRLAGGRVALDIEGEVIGESVREPTVFSSTAFSSVGSARLLLSLQAARAANGSSRRRCRRGGMRGEG
jgi:hypothetical protein